MINNLNKKADNYQEEMSNIIDSKDFLFDLVEHSITEIYILDKESYKFIYANKGAENNLGYNQKELCEKTALDIKPYIDKNKYENILSPLLNNEAKKVVFHTKYRRKDETMYDAEVHVQILKSGDKEVLAQIVLDVSDRKKAEKDLIESEFKFRTVADYTNDWEYWEDLNGNIIYISPSCLRITGYAQQEFRDNINLKSDIIHPDDIDIFSEHIKDTHQIEYPEPVEYLRYRLIRKDGAIVHIEHTCRAIYDSEGKYLGRRISNRDITDRIEVLERLKQSEEKYRQLFDILPVGITVADKSGQIVASNELASSILGLSTQEHHSRDIDGPEWEIIRDDGTIMPPEEYISVKALRDNKAYYNVVMGIKKANSDIIWITVNAKPVENLGVVVTYMDITDKKKIQQDLDVASEWNSMLLNTSCDGIHILDANGNLIECNERFCKMLGYSQTESMQLNVRDWDVQWTSQELISLIETLLDEPRLVETIHKRKDGSTFNVEINTVGIEVQGKKFLHASSRDVTERKTLEKNLKESEKKLRTFFSTMSDMVVLHDLVFDAQGNAVDYRIVDCNEMYMKVFNINKEQVVGKLGSEFYGFTPPPYIDIYATVAQYGEPSRFDVHYEPMEKYFDINVVSTEKNSFATITSDITSIKKYEEYLNSKNEELEKYLYIASHDLRSPLVNIHGFSQRIEKVFIELRAKLEDCDVFEKDPAIGRIFDSKIPKSLQYIYTNVQKMDVLLNGLLQLSRTGRIALTIHKLNMVDLVNSILNAKQFQIDEIEGEIIISDLPECYGDRDLINQLFSNLLSNAITYRSPERKLEVEISGTTKYRKSIYQIKDNGIGISARNMEKIWDIFYRVDPASEVSGEGIGLSIVKNIIDKHHGKIWLESELGQGTTFYIELDNFYINK